MNQETTHFNESKINSLQKIFSHIFLHARFNDYVYENVVVGKLKPNDSLPFDNFVTELNLEKFNPYANRSAIEGSAITNDHRVVNQSVDYFYKDFFTCKMSSILSGAHIFRQPRQKNEFADDLIDNKDFPDYRKYFPKYNVRVEDFLLELYPLFVKIANQKIHYEFFDTISIYSKEDRRNINEGAHYFLCKMITTGKRLGARVDSYIKKMIIIPDYIKKLIRLEKDHYYIDNDDISSLDFKIAVLSAMNFESVENAMIFELKLKQWIKEQNG